MGEGGGYSCNQFCEDSSTALQSQRPRTISNQDKQPEKLFKTAKIKTEGNEKNILQEKQNICAIIPFVFTSDRVMKRSTGFFNNTADM